MKDILHSPLKLLPLRVVTLDPKPFAGSFLEVEQDTGVVPEVFGNRERDEFVGPGSIPNKLIAFWAVFEKVDSLPLLTSIVEVQHVVSLLVHLSQTKVLMRLNHAGHV